VDVSEKVLDAQCVETVLEHGTRPIKLVTWFPVLGTSPQVLFTQGSPLLASPSTITRI
jgi:hypothetical protein